MPPITTTGPLNNGLFKGDYIISSHHHLSGMYFVSKSNMLRKSVPRATSASVGDSRYQRRAAV